VFSICGIDQHHRNPLVKIADSDTTSAATLDDIQFVTLDRAGSMPEIPKSTPDNERYGVYS
jgi:hypothetical protein